MSNNRLRKRPTKTRTLTFAWDPDDVDELNSLRVKAETAKAEADRPAKGATVAAKRKATDAADEAQQAVDDYLTSIPTVTFHLRSCGPKKAEKLMAKMPPTDEQVERHERDRAAENAALEAAGRTDRVPGLQFDPDRFPVALVAACCTKIVLTDPDGDDQTIDDPDDDTIADLFDQDGWTSMDGAVLFATCQQLTQGMTMVPSELVDRLGKD